MELSQETLKQIETDWSKYFWSKIDEWYSRAEYRPEIKDSYELFQDIMKVFTTKYEAAQKRAEELQAEVERMKSRNEAIEKFLNVLRQAHRFGGALLSDVEFKQLESLLNQKQ